jgi:hypothetical protein
LSLFRQFIFSDWLFSNLLTGFKQLVDIFAYLTKRLVVLLGKALYEIVRK